MDENKNKPKISFPEALIAGMFLFGLPDAIEFLLIFFGLDDFWLVDLFAFPGSMIYLKIKGVKTTYALIGNIIELIPYVGFLPIRTIAFIILVIIENNKDKIQVGLKVAGQTAKVAKIIPQARPYAEAIEKGSKIAQKTIDYSNKKDLKTSFSQKPNFPTKNILENQQNNQDIITNNNSNITNIKNIPKQNNIDVEKLIKKDYNKVEIDDSQNIINLKNAT